MGLRGVLQEGDVQAASELQAPWLPLASKDSGTDLCSSLSSQVPTHALLLTGVPRWWSSLGRQLCRRL